MQKGNKFYYYSLPDKSYLATRQSYVQRFTLIYSCTTLIFSAYFSPQDFNLIIAFFINVLLFLIGAPYWFRKTNISEFNLNIVSQISNAAASIWAYSLLGPASHVNLVAIPQFVLVLMMFAGKNQLLNFTLGTVCMFQLSLPFLPFANSWSAQNGLPKSELAITRELMDLSILILTIYQFIVISKAWRDALVIVNDEKTKLQNENEWRLRLLRILTHDIKEPMVSSLQLLRKFRKMNVNPDQKLMLKIINQIESSQIMIREIISNVETFASADEDLQLPKSLISPFEVLEKLNPWLKSRLEDKSIAINHSNIKLEHQILANPETFTYQIFLNLLSNAIKFSPINAKIIISTTLEDETIIWRIRDFGKGINPRALSDQQFSEPGTLGESGSGLGIRIALLLAKKQDLRLEWKTHPSPESGTEVFIYATNFKG